MNNYTAEITHSTKELTARERIKMKDLSNAISIDTLTSDASTVIAISGYVIIHVTNPKSENPEYDVIVAYSPDGQKYYTSSTSFMESLFGIWDELANEEICEVIELEVYRKESKNYKGKTFITCSLV